MTLIHLIHFDMKLFVLNCKMVKIKWLNGNRVILSEMLHLVNAIIINKLYIYIYTSATV